MDFNSFLKSAASVHPSPRQQAWFDTEFYAFVHFTVNTYTGLEWGLGNESPSIFNPVDLDCDEWVAAVKSAGMKGLILTAKHHDGFCLWPSAYTEHSVKNSPWKNGQGDVVRECAEACRRGGIKFGVYLSPWDRNSPYYGSDAYNDYYCNQLTELLTNYGELFMIWFDGACGEGPNGKKQVYDFARYNALIRKYQPGACIFNGPDVRWNGNESGSERRAEWAVVPAEMNSCSEVQTGPGPLADGTDMSYLFDWDQNIGELNNILYSRGLTFRGAEFPLSIRPGWFYHANEEPHPTDLLFNIYVNSCGANAALNLNIPPMPSGRFDPRDIARLKELGQALENAFGEDKKLPCTVERVAMDNPAQCKYILRFAQPVNAGYVELKEDLSVGQRVEHFRILAGDACAYQGYTIGHRKLCKVNTETDTLTVYITGARDEVVLRDLCVYKA